MRVSEKANVVKGERRGRFRRRLSPYLWVLPVLVIVGGVLVYPWLWSLGLSFYSWNPLRGTGSRFVGLANYLRIFSDAEFHLALRNTALLTVISVTLEFLIGFGLALLLNMEIRARAFFRTACLIPMMLTPSIVGLSWKVLLHDELGLVNWVLGLFGIPAIGWMSDPGLTLLVIAAIQTWQHAPFVMLILLAGLQSVPLEPLEAARVDGASPVQVFWHVVLPWLRPLIIIVLLFRIIFAVRTFDVVYGLWQGSGPVKAGMVLGVYLYEQIRVFWRLGEGAAISYVLLAITALFSFWFALKMYRGFEE
jgi:multiple sugar transport system permease protein